MKATRCRRRNLAVLAIVLSCVLLTLIRSRWYVATSMQALSSPSYTKPRIAHLTIANYTAGYLMDEETVSATPMHGKTTLMRPRLEFHSLTDYTPDQGFDPVTPMAMDEQSVYKHLEYYGLNKSQPIIYFITPTYKRTTQMVDLVRLSQALHMDLGIYWIVVEDATNCTKRVRDIIDRVGLPYAHLAAPTKKEMHIRGSKSSKPHRGVDQRNLALDWVETISKKVPGVVYFGDDDNAYDARLFDELRQTKNAGIFGVAFRGKGLYQRCLVDPETGKVTKIVDGLGGDRKYPIDMAGFSVHTSRIRATGARFHHEWQSGFLESNFLSYIVNKMEDLEPLAYNCTRIYAWHVKTDGARDEPRDEDPDFERIAPSV